MTNGHAQALSVEEGVISDKTIETKDCNQLEMLQMDNLLEQRLTCNRIFRHLIFYSLQKFTGKIKVFSHQGQTWSFYFLLGHMIWASGGRYPLRRWRRQHYAATGQLPKLEQIDWDAESWDCTELRVLTESNSLAGEQVQTIIKGVLEEVLFDVVQAFETPIYQSLNVSKSLVPVSQLTGIGDGMELEVQEGVSPDRYYRLPYSMFPNVKGLQKTIFRNWKKWVNLGLACVSPNQAPLLLEPEKLQYRVSPKVYANMAKGLQGQSSLRDLAFKFKKDGNFLTLASAMAPYYEEQLIAFNEIKDLSVNNLSKGSYSTLTVANDHQDESIFLVIDSNRKNQSLLSAIAQRNGYTFEGVSNGINAIQKISENPTFKPKVIFASYDMAVIKPAEFCTILRRLELETHIPIIIYSKQPIPNREAQQIVSAGANELTTKTALTPNYIRSILKKYQQLPENSRQQTIDQKTYSNFKLTFQQPNFSTSRA